MNVYRPNLSEYFNLDFKIQEKLKMESLDNITYVNSWEEHPHILLTNTSAKINMEKLDHVQLIVHANSGQEPYDKNFVENFHGSIVTGNVIRVQAVVQYILSCIFQRYSSPPFSRQWDNSRNWGRTLLEDLKVLLIGYGHIGRKLVSVLTSLQVHPNIYDPWQGYHNLEYKNADMVILCCSENYLNKYLINADFLNELSSQATIINSARGSLVEESSLVHFLENNPNAFAFVDVYEKEPFSSKKFHHLSNIATSSHVAGVFKTIEQKIIDFEYNVIKDFISSPQTFKIQYADSILSPHSFVGEAQ